MKAFALTIIGVVILCSGIYSQTYNRHYNPAYMWTSLDENFSGSDLDRSVWGTTTQFKRNIGFLIDSPKTIQIKSGNLELKMRSVHGYLDSLWTVQGWKHDYPDYVGGEIVTKNKYRYGIFECRAKYALKSGSWPAFWLIGNDGIPCPPGLHGSEIDIAELSCQSDFPTMMHVIHRYYPTDNCEVTKQVNRNEKRYHLSGRATYSTYKCIWTPEKIQYFINDQLMHEVINHNYEWFPSIPLTLILSQQVTQGFDLLNEIKQVTPQTSYFDWVKVRQFFQAPEISIPNLITSKGIATMDVDSLANNIAWKLTPSELFTTSEGTGKTAHIIRATNSTVPGKITYTFQMPSGEVFTSEKIFK
jgi:beta-glucanase (GH16 family)